MAVTNLYSNLPGHLVEFKDGGLQLTSSSVDTSSTKSLLILGTATDGPINEPVKIDVTTVSQVFGKEVDDAGYPNGATLTKYAKQAFKNGFDDVRCMRVTGSQAYTTIYGQQTSDYENASKTISKPGAIAGNKAFSVNFTTLSNPCFIAKNQGPNDNLYIVRNGEEQGIGFSSQVGGSYIPFTGFSINPNVYTKFDAIRIECEGFRFVGTIPDEQDSIVSHNIEQISVTVTSETTGEPEEEVTTTTKIATLNPAEVFTDSQGNEYLLWKDPDNINHNALNALPEVGSDGFVLMLNDQKLVKGVDYTQSTDSETGIITFTINVDSVEDQDTIDVVYWPYEELQINEQFTDVEFNESEVDVSEVNDLAEASIQIINVKRSSDGVETAIKSTRPEDEDFNDLFEYDEENSVVKVKDTSGFKVGDKVEIVFNYKKPIMSDLELKIKSQFGGSVYKTGTVAVEKVTEDGVEYTNIIFKRPSAKKLSNGNPSYSYSSKYYTTIDDLILAMKNDASNLNMFEVEIVKGEGTYPLDMLQTTAETALSSGGDDGIKPTANQMFEALSGERYKNSDIGTPITVGSTDLVTADMVGYLKAQGAYQILENYNVDFIYPAGVYADLQQTVDPHSDFQKELALVCAVLTYRTKMTHGFIDVKPNSNTTLVGIDNYVAKLVNNHPNVYYMTDQDGNVLYDSEGKPMDIGWYTSVVVGPEVVMQSDTLGTYYGSPAIAYAALNAVIEPQSSPINKALRNVNGVKFKFSNKQMDAMAGNRMVVFKLKNEGLATASSIPFVVNGVTSGAKGCDYSDIAIVKVVTDVVDQIREVADPFIGESNTVEQRNALSALISKRLTKLVEIGEIQSYEFEVSATIQQQLLGEASIALTIVPALTLRQITTVVALRAAQ